MAAPQGEFNRSVQVEITNNTENQFFTSPVTYIYSGYIHSSPTPLINPGKKGDALFVRTSGTARGSVGVLTYAFGRTQFSLLFSNPYDYNLYRTVLALYIPYEPEPTDGNLYDKMYYDLAPSESFDKVELDSGTGKIFVRGGNVVVSAITEKMENCIIDIDIRDV
ncbi:hydra actinoporin-like toxin 5 [Heterodontus francisci]|uniref:hydra actinoporin-like toxin 5 n=1 Tax=Heterodontus francisci TaxID=7792 RepID=UPI00355BFEFA